MDCHGRGFYLFWSLKPLGFHGRWFYLFRPLRPLGYHFGDMYIRRALPPLRLEESEVTINSIQAPSQIGCLVQLVPTCSTREVLLIQSNTNTLLVLIPSSSSRQKDIWNLFVRCQGGCITL